MRATIWHNPNCSTSRKVLDILRATPGIELTIVEYLKVGWARETLECLFARAGITPAEALRTRGTDAVERGLPGAGDERIIAAMIAEPVLVERPWVETEKGAVLCRPVERVHELL